MTKIKFKLVGEEPVCTGDECPEHEFTKGLGICLANNGEIVESRTSSCIPGLRQQRDEAQANLAEAQAVIERVREREGKLVRFVHDAKHWRRDCWDYDDDIDHDWRDFSDDEEWDRLSEQADRALLTPAPVTEGGDSDEA